jgi:hypothetical protein
LTRDWQTIKKAAASLHQSGVATLCTFLPMVSAQSLALPFIFHALHSWLIPRPGPNFSDVCKILHLLTSKVISAGGGTSSGCVSDVEASGRRQARASMPHPKRTTCKHSILGVGQEDDNLERFELLNEENYEASDRHIGICPRKKIYHEGAHGCVLCDVMLIVLRTLTDRARCLHSKSWRNRVAKPYNSEPKAETDQQGAMIFGERCFITVSTSPHLHLLHSAPPTLPS